MQTQGWKYNFEITKEGEEFIDAYSSHYKRIFGSSAGRPDSETLVMWLTEIRETANFPQTQEKLEKIEGFQKAQAAVDWAVGRRYLEEIVGPPMEDLPGVDPYLSRSGVPHIRELMVELRKAKARGDEAEYARLLDLSIHPEAPLTNLETCEDCGQQYSPDAPDDWGTHLHQTCNKCHAKNLGRPRGRY